VSEDNSLPKPLLDLQRLRESWLIELRAQRKSPATLSAYNRAVGMFLDTHIEMTKPAVMAWLAGVADSEPATVRLRLAAIKQFAKWLAAEEYLDADPIRMIPPPKLDQKPVAALSEDEVRRLIKACAGMDWRDKRDKAMVLVLRDTGLRAGELLALDVADIDLVGCVALVTRGKGGRARRSKFGATAAAAIDRYQRAVSAYDGPLWRGRDGRLTYTGLTNSLRQRAEQAGIKGFHVHRMRHSAAVRWLAAGGSEGGLMAQAGWKDRTMIDRYLATAREDLAAAEFDRLRLDTD
jgi:integrase/recombinase XerD